MPCWVYIRGDEEAITCNEPADVVLERIERADAGAFIHVVMAPLARDDEPRTGYVMAGEIVAVLPIHPRQFDAELDNPPDWY